MRVVSSNFTVADYCNGMKDRSILINREYQAFRRSGRPPPARTSSIRSCGDIRSPSFPSIRRPICAVARLSRKLSMASRGSQAILDFFNEDLRLSGKSIYAGKKLGQLEDDEQRKIHRLSPQPDLFVDATEQDIRQMFRRINSYNVPGMQEKRHATYQGNLKWFVVGLCDKYDLHPEEHRRVRGETICPHG